MTGNQLKMKSNYRTSAWWVLTELASCYFFYHFQVVVATANSPGLVSMMRSLQTYHRLLSRQGRLVLVAPRTADISCQANNKCQEVRMWKNTSLCCLYVVWYSQDWVGCWSHLISLRHQCKVFPMNGSRNQCPTWCLCTFTDPKENLLSRIWNHTLLSFIACCFSPKHTNHPKIDTNLSNPCFDEFSIRFSHGFPQSSILKNQWEFQDPKMEVLYHISGHMLWGYSLT